MWQWVIDYLEWIILAPFIVWFIFRELPVLIWKVKNTKNDGSDDDPGGNDNIKRNFYDNM